MGVLDDENAGQQTAPATPTFSSPFTVSTTPTAIVSTPAVEAAGNDATASAAPAASPAPVDAGGNEALKQKTIAGYVNQRPGKVMFTAASGVVVRAAIIDRTSTGGMTPKALSILNTVAENAAAAGIMQIDVTAAKGGGHLSHRGGTEWDVKGYTADGKLWSPEQRAAVAAAGASAGANRFGLYSFGKGFLGNGSLHIGYSGPGRPAAVWGFRGRTSGDAARAFTNPAEARFLSMFNAGKLGTGYKSFVGSALAIAPADGPTPAAAAATAQATGAPIPPARPDTASPAFGAKGARSMPEPFLLDTLGAAVIDRGRIVGKGDRGEHVAELQAFLNLQGFRDAHGNPLETDGIFGRLTKQALKAYQARSSITVDGRLGPETYQAMLFDLSPGTAVMPGKAAYDLGNRVAGKIVDPAAPDAAVPLPRRRPVQEVDIPLPRRRPGSAVDLPDPLADRGTALDRQIEAGAARILGKERAGGSLPDPLLDRGTEATRAADRAVAADLGLIYSRDAADRAMMQRFDDAHGPAATIDAGAVAIRTGEAIREFVRGLADRYRQVIDAKRTIRNVLTITEARTKDDAALPAPAPEGLATLTPYGFGPDAARDGQTRPQWLAERAARRLGNL